MFPLHPNEDLFAISSDLDQQPQDQPSTLMIPQDLVILPTDYDHIYDHDQHHAYIPQFNSALSSNGQMMLIDILEHHPPSLGFPSNPFFSGQTFNDNNNNNNNNNIGSDGDGEGQEKKKKKMVHREIERHRRQEMNALYASLRCLLPSQFLKGKRAVSDQLNAALDYINLLQKKIKKLETKRARLKKISNNELMIISNRNNIALGGDDQLVIGSCSIAILPYIKGFEIVVHSDHEEKCLPISRVIRVLLNEGMDVVSFAATKINHAIIHTIQTEAGDSTSVDVPRLQWKLNEIFNTAYR